MINKQRPKETETLEVKEWVQHIYLYIYNLECCHFVTFWLATQLVNASLSASNDTLEQACMSYKEQSPYWSAQFNWKWISLNWNEEKKEKRENKTEYIWILKCVYHIYEHNEQSSEYSDGDWWWITWSLSLDIYSYSWNYVHIKPICREWTIVHIIAIFMKHVTGYVQLRANSSFKPFLDSVFCF